MVPSSAAMRRDSDDGAAILPMRGVAVGLACVAALTLLKLALDDSLGRPTPYLLYFGAALAAAWYGGTRAGAFTSAVAVTAGYLLFARGPDVSEPAALVGAGGAALECLVIVLITSRLRQSTFGAERGAGELRRVIAQLRAVVNGSGEGVTMQDAAGKLIFANDLAARLCGFDDAEQMLATDLRDIASRFELLDADGRPLSYGALPARVLLEGGEPAEVLLRFRVRATGVERWSRVRANAVRDEGGAIRHVVNTFRDVTDERTREHDLEVTREWLATALRSIGDAVVATDEKGRISFLNPVAEQLTGWPSKDAAGRPLADVFHILNESTREVVPSPVDRVIAEGIVVGLANHTVLVRRDGTEISIDDSAAPIRDASGALVGVVLVFRDVSTQRRKDLRKAFLMRATAELNSSLDYATTLATVARLAVPAIADWCAVDVRETPDAPTKRLAVAHVDPAKVKMVGEIEARYPPDPNAPRGVPNVFRTGQAEMMESIPADLLDAAAIDDEHRRLIRGLSLRSYIAAPIRHGGQTLGVISLVMAESNRNYGPDDLDAAIALGERAAVAVENARLYRETDRLRAEAEAANRSKDEFLAMLGHELRNPLAPIVTALHLLELRGGDEGARERGVIRRQLDHVVRLVDDLLDVSRITRGKIELTRENVALADVVERAIETSTPLLQAQGHALEIDVPSGLVVNGDRTRLAQVVTNLLQNAAKYTPAHGHVRIHATRDGSQIALHVRDDGRGIAPELLPRVFDVFTQGQQDAARASGGLGLGLAIVKSLVSVHGGSVEARSDGLGRGTEMIVRLPAAVAEAGVAAAPARERRPERSTGETVLIVDDNADGREMMAMGLELAGYRVVTAEDGPSALTVVSSARPQVALLDIGLPGMDGYELARRLRRMPELAPLKLVAVTGYGQQSDRDRAREAGFDAHLTKPLEIAELVATLEKLRG